MNNDRSSFCGGEPGRPGWSGNSPASGIPTELIDPAAGTFAPVGVGFYLRR